MLYSWYEALFARMLHFVSSNHVLCSGVLMLTFYTHFCKEHHSRCSDLYISVLREQKSTIKSSIFLFLIGGSRR